MKQLYSVSLYASVSRVGFHNTYYVVASGMTQAIDKAVETMKERNETSYVEVKKAVIVRDEEIIIGE